MEKQAGGEPERSKGAQEEALKKRSLLRWSAEPPNDPLSLSLSLTQSVGGLTGTAVRSPLNNCTFLFLPVIHFSLPPAGFCRRCERNDPHLPSRLLNRFLLPIACRPCPQLSSFPPVFSLLASPREICSRGLNLAGRLSCSARCRKPVVSRRKKTKERGKTMSNRKTSKGEIARESSKHTK